MICAVLKRTGEEIRLLSTMALCFINVTRKKSSNSDNDSSEIANDLEHPIEAVLRRTWSCLSHIAQKYSYDEVISEALGGLLTNIVPIREQEGGSISILNDLCEMATVMMTVATQDSNTATLSPTLEFVKEVVDTYGYHAEIGVMSDPSLQLPALLTPSHLKGIQDIIERLLKASAVLVGSAVGDIWSPPKQVHGQSPFEGRPERRIIVQTKSPEALSGIFLVLAACLRRCPVLLIQLNGGQERGNIFVRSVEAAAITVSDKEIDTVRSAITFLTAAIKLSDIKCPQGTDSPWTLTANASRWKAIGPTVDDSISRVRGDVISRLLCGACGVMPRETLDRAAELLHSILLMSSNEESETAIMSSLRQEYFMLGDEAVAVTVKVLSLCANGSASPSLLMELFSYLWQLHQSDDTGAVAGGEAVEKFKLKFSLI